MMSKNKVPQIRFKGFSEDWATKNLDEKAIITMGQSPDSSTYNENLIGLPLIQGNADCKDRKTAPRIFASLFTKECFENDIIMTVRAPVGYISKSIHHACIGRGVCAIKSKEDNNFLFQFLINYENKWLKYSQGSTFTAVNSEDIKNLNICLPYHKEQTKIGNYFQQLDKLIEQKEKKYQKLKQFKKAMLDKMFPKNGADVPELRFKGFSDKWEEKEFRDNIMSIQAGTYLLGAISNTGTPLIKMGNIQRGYFTFEKVEYLEKNVKVEEENIANYGDFFFNTRNTLDLVGKGATWTRNSGEFAFNNNIARFTFTGIDTIFFNYLYNTVSIIKQVQARAMGTTSVAAIYPKNLNSIKYYLPNLEEQSKIGNYFQKLDKQIDLQKKELEKLKNIKKASLDKMFV